MFAMTVFGSENATWRTVFKTVAWMEYLMITFVSSGTRLVAKGRLGATGHWR